MRPRAPSPVVWRILPLLAALGSALVSPGKSPAAQACLTTGAHAKHSGANCTACHLVPGAPCFDSAGPAAAPGQPAPAFDAAAKTCANVACHGLAATPAWNSGASLGCNGCHGTHTTNGAPDYPSGSPKANSHSVHP